MKDYIFVPAFGNRPRDMVGREEVLKVFNDCLHSEMGSRERTLLILGQWGSGKTVLLLELAEMARKEGFVVAPPTIVSKGMLDRIIEKIEIESERIIPKKRAKVSGGNVSALGFGAGIQLHEEETERKSFAARIDQFCAKLNEKGIPLLILIDEVQGENNELRQLVIAYQEMIGAGRNISIVFAGLHTSVSNMLNDHVLTFLNRAPKIELPPLRYSDIEAYYRKCFKEMKITIDDQQINELADAAQGSPYMMQLLGHYVVLYTDNSEIISNTAFQKVIQVSEENFKNDICGTTIAPLSDHDVEFLIAMTKDEGESEMKEIAQRMGKSDAYAQTYKRRLIQAGVITQMRRGRVSFAVPYLREHLMERYE